MLPDPASKELTKKRKLSQLQKSIMFIVAVPSLIVMLMRAYNDIVYGEFSLSRAIFSIVILSFCAAIIIHARRSTSGDYLARSFDLAERLEKEKH